MAPTVLPEQPATEPPAPPVPGGELGGSWGTPTVDAIHGPEGLAHAAFQRRTTVAAIVFKDAEDGNKYKYILTDTRTIGATTSATDAGAVINAAFAAIGTGNVGYYAALTILTKVTIPSGCGIIGPGGRSHTSPYGPALVAGATFPADNLLVVQSGSNNSVIINVSVDATNGGSPTALRAFVTQGDDVEVVCSSFLGGTTNACQVNSNRVSFSGVDCRFSSGVVFSGGAGADFQWTGGRCGAPSGSQASMNLTATFDGPQIANIHITNTNGNAPNLVTAATHAVFTGVYYDTAGGTAHIVVNGGPANFNGGHIRAGLNNTEFPGGFPIFNIAAGPVTIGGGIYSENTSGTVTNTWSAVANIASGVSVSFGQSFWAGLATPTIAGAFTGAGSPPTLDRTVTLNGTPVMALLYQAAIVAADETTASTSYVDLATTTDTITLNVGASGVVVVQIQADIFNSGAGQATKLSVSVDGGAAVDANAITGINAAATTISKMLMLSGLSRGAHTFKLKARVAAGTGHFSNRSVLGWPV